MRGVNAVNTQLINLKKNANTYFLIKKHYINLIPVKED